MPHCSKPRQRSLATRGWLYERTAMNYLKHLLERPHINEPRCSWTTRRTRRNKTCLNLFHPKRRSPWHSLPGSAQDARRLVRISNMRTFLLSSSVESRQPTTSRSSESPGQLKLSSKGDVQALLGRPNGKSLCPSVLADYKDRCKSAEVWAWSASPRQSTFGNAPLESSSIFVHFDSGGMVTNVENIQSSASRDRARPFTQ